MTSTSTSVKIAIVLVISLFFLWGLSYGLVDVMNKNFQNHLHITQHESGFLQMAYFGAYFIIALPAGYIAQRFSYKVGILMGLGLYALGCLLIIPATNMASFHFFLFAFFILACGLGSLETNANPYITKLGSPESASFRINAAQSFNGMGQFVGPILAGYLFLSITKAPENASDELKEQLLTQNMGNVQLVYVGIAIIVALIALAFLFNKLPENIQMKGAESEAQDTSNVKASSIFKERHFTLGLLAQFLYIASQVGAGAFFINYAVEHYHGLSDQQAAYYFSSALIAFMAGRIITTPLMKKISPHFILGIYGFLSTMLCVALVFGEGFFSILALIGLFFFMSIAFPTIFALSTKNLNTAQTKLASSLLIMSIVGGAIMPSIMGLFNDRFGTSAGFLLLIPCFAYVAWYGFFGSKCKRCEKV